MVIMKIYATITYSLYKILTLFVMIIFLISIIYNLVNKKWDNVILFSLLSIVYLFVLLYLQFTYYKITVNSEIIEVGNFYFGKKELNRMDCKLIKGQNRGILFETYFIQYQNKSKKYKFISSKFMYNENMIRKIIFNKI